MNNGGVGEADGIMGARVRYQVVRLYQLMTGRMIATCHCAVIVLVALLTTLGNSVGAAAAVQVEFTQAAGDRVPTSGWQAAALPQVWAHAVDDRRALWVRLHFYAVRGQPVALLSDRIRERYSVALNGTELYHSNADDTDRSFEWHRPLFLFLPAALLRSGDNTLIFRVDTDNGRALAVGHLTVSDEGRMRVLYRQILFLGVAGPAAITGVLLILAAGSLLFWIARPRERIFGWLALVGLFWAICNLQYFLDVAPFDDGLFWTLNADAIFLVLWAGLGFAAAFLDLPRRRRYLISSAAVCAVGIAVRHGLIAVGLSPMAGYFVMWPVALGTIYLFALACRRNGRVENVVMLVATSLSVGFGFHDLIVIATGWRGVGFQLQPYGGLLMFLAFGFALGRRVLVALATVEDLNLTLEQRVRDAGERLRLSEAERQRLEIASAVDGERARLMREIHDGIGSSLITALAVAKRDRQSDNTVATLKRSLADLRIGVDSLEPNGGDVVMLLASFRHRMKREMTDAGIAFHWKRMTAPSLPWLDAVGALHILRILQEAVSNILAHAEASNIAVDCIGAPYQGAAGVLVSIHDDGHGFTPTTSHGRGLVNMRSRAASLNAVFACDSDPMGTRLTLWLPLSGRR